MAMFRIIYSISILLEKYFADIVEYGSSMNHMTFNVQLLTNKGKPCDMRET